MNTVNLPVIKGIADSEFQYHETKTVAVPINLCMDLFSEIPKRTLQKLLPPTLEIRGFRTPTKAPARIIFENLRDSKLLGVILSYYCMDVVGKINEMSVKQIRVGLADLVQEYSPAMVRFALYINRRKSVRNLCEQFDALMNTPVALEDHTHGNDAVAEAASASDLDEQEDIQRLELSCAKTKQTKDEKADINGVLQKRLAKAERQVAERDEQIRKLRQEKGERDRLLGQFRREIEEQQRQIEQLSRQLHDSKQKLAQLRHLEQELNNTAERERKLETRERVFESLFGTGATDLKNQLLDGTVHIHDLESQLACLHMLLTEQDRQRDAILGNLHHVAHVPVATCIDIVRQYLESVLQQQIAHVGKDAVGTAAERLVYADAIKELLQAIATLERLGPNNEQAKATHAIEIPLAELRQQLDAIETVKLELVGLLRYEGPQVWLVTQEQVVGLPHGLLEQDDLVTGNKVRLILYHDRNTLVDMEAEVVERVESQVINDALRYGDEGLYVQSHSGQPVMISQYEFLRAQVEVGEPLQVVVPKRPYPKGSQTLYGRIAKKLEHSGLYLQPRKVVGSAQKKNHGESGAIEFQPLLAGQNVLVVGGDGNEQCYQTVVEGMGGRFDFQSGFEQLARIPGKVRSANLVILVTSCVLHAVGDLAHSEAKRTNTPFYFFNSLGRTSFIRFIEELYTNELVPGTAASRAS